MIVALVILGWMLSGCVALAAISRWEYRRWLRNLSSVEAWALLMRGSTRWK